jgi:hypothetical protein
MSAAQVYAAVTCLTGVILLLGWLYVTSDNPRSIKLLIKSVLFFVLPGILLALVPPSLVQFPLALWVGTLIEEALKAGAVRGEQTKLDRFFLVSLFGIWELALGKPGWGLAHAGLLDNYTNLQLVGLTMGGMITVLMHAVTAEIYAFRFEGRLGLAVAVSWAIHTAFDEAIDLLGVSLVAGSLLFMVLIIMFVALWPTGLRLDARAPSP